MKVTGIREVRQQLSTLLEDVKNGREVVITDRGRPVARLTAIERRLPFPDLTAVRRRMRDPVDLSQAVLEDRDDRV